MKTVALFLLTNVLVPIVVAAVTSWFVTRHKIKLREVEWEHEKEDDLQSCIADVSAALDQVERTGVPAAHRDAVFAAAKLMANKDPELSQLGMQMDAMVRQQNYQGARAFLNQIVIARTNKT